MILTHKKDLTNDIRRSLWARTRLTLVKAHLLLFIQCNRSSIRLQCHLCIWSSTHITMNIGTCDIGMLHCQFGKCCIDRACVSGSIHMEGWGTGQTYINSTSVCLKLINSVRVNRAVECDGACIGLEYGSPY